MTKSDNYSHVPVEANSSFAAPASTPTKCPFVKKPPRVVEGRPPGRPVPKKGGSGKGDGKMTKGY